MEVLSGDAVKAPEMAPGLVPEVLDPVDVIPVIDEGPGMFDARMMEPGHVRHVASAEAVGTDDAVGFDLLPDDREKRFRPGVRDDDGMNLPAPLEEPEHRNLAARSPSAPAFPDAAETTLVHLDPAGRKLRRFSDDPPGNESSRGLWKYGVAVCRFTPARAAADRAVEPPTKYLISSIWIPRGSRLRRRPLTI